MNNSYYTFIQVSNTSTDAFNVGLIAFNEQKAWVKISPWRRSMAGKLVGDKKDALVYILKEIETKIKKNKINLQQTTLTQGSGYQLSTAYIEYLRQYSNGIIKFSAPIQIDEELNQESVEKLFLALLPQEKPKEEIGTKNLGSIIKSIQDDMRPDTGVDGDGQRLSQLAWMLFLKLIQDKEDEFALDDDYESPLPTEARWGEWTPVEKYTPTEMLVFVNDVLFPMLKSLNPDQYKGKAKGIAYTVQEVFKDANNYMKNGVQFKKVVGHINKIDFNSSQDRHLFNDVYEQMLRELQSAGNYGEFYTPRPVTNFVIERVAPRFGDTVLDPACGTGGFLVSALNFMEKEQTLDTHQKAKVGEYIKGIEWKTLPYSLAVTNLILHDIESPKIQHKDAFTRPLNDYTSEDRVECIVANPPFGGTTDDTTNNNFTTAYKTKETADLFLVLIIELLKIDGRAGLVLPDGSLSGEGIKSRIRQKLLEECNLHTIVRLDNSVFKPYATVKTNLLFFTKGEPTKEIWYFHNPLPEGMKGYSKTKPIQDKDFDILHQWWHNRVENEYAYKVGIEEIQKRGYDLDIKHPNAIQEEIIEEPYIIKERIFAKMKALETYLQELG